MKDMSNDELLQAIRSSGELSVGDRVELVSGGGASPLFGFNNGGIYHVAKLEHIWSATQTLIQIKRKDSQGTVQGTGYATREQLRKV